MRRLLSSVSVAALALGFAANTASADGWYIQGFGGGAVLDTSSTTMSEPKKDYDFSFNNPGYVVGGTAGYDFGSVRVELDGSFTKIETDNVGDKSAILTNGNMHISALAVNVLYDIPVNVMAHPVEFYVGTGAGGAIYDLHDLGVAYLGSMDNVSPQFNLQAGVIKSITENVGLFVTYKVTYTPSWSASDNGYKAEIDNLVGHQVLFGVRYTF